MKRTLVACLAVAFGATSVLAASPEVAKAIKTIQSVEGDAAKMKAFCALLDTTYDDDEDEEGATAEKAAADGKESAADEEEDAAVDAQADKALAELGADFKAAWDLGPTLDEASADSKEYTAAIDALEAKCE